MRREKSSSNNNKIASVSPYIHVYLHLYLYLSIYLSISFLYIYVNISIFMSMFFSINISINQPIYRNKRLINWLKKAVSSTIFPFFIINYL